jgi:NDP-sugar pyrophosphorylase family protein
LQQHKDSYRPTNEVAPVGGVFLLSAGFGTRLKPISNTIPKPLMPIAGVPMLGWDLYWSQNICTKNIFINTHYLPNKIGDYLAASPIKALKKDRQLHVIHEIDILGTGGGLTSFCPLIDPLKYYVVKAADIFFPDWAPYANSCIETMAKNKLSLGMVLTNRHVSGTTYVSINSQQRVSGFSQNQPSDRGDFSTYSALMVIRGDLIAKIPPLKFSPITELISQEIAGGHLPLALKIGADSYWRDIGTPQSLLDTNLEVLGRFDNYLARDAQLKSLLASHQLEYHPSSAQRSSISAPIIGPSNALSSISESSQIGPHAVIDYRVSCLSGKLSANNALIMTNHLAPEHTYSRCICIDGTSVDCDHTELD